MRQIGCRDAWDSGEMVPNASIRSTHLDATELMPL